MRILGVLAVVCVMGFMFAYFPRGSNADGPSGQITIEETTAKALVYSNPALPSDGSASDVLSAQNRKNVARLISRNHYLQPDYETVERQAMSFTSVQRYLKSLDAYSRIAFTEEIEFVGARGQLSRVGPGIDYLFEGQDVLIHPIYNGPLYNSGIETAAVLESINDKQLDIKDFHSYAFLAAIKAQDTVRLVMHVPPESESIHVSTVAQRYENLPVRHYQSDESQVLEIRQFRGGQTNQIRSAIAAAQSLKSLIIDLRFSPGGDIYAMTDWLSLFLPENQLIAILQTARYTDPTELRTLSGQLAINMPIVILISRYTASSAEIFARVLDMNLGQQVELVGEPTKGKCLAQTSFSVSGEFVLVLSTNEVLLADGESCDGQKLQPDKAIRHIEFKNIDEIITAVGNVG